MNEREMEELPVRSGQGNEANRPRIGQQSKKSDSLRVWRSRTRAPPGVIWLILKEIEVLTLGPPSVRMASGVPVTYR